MALQIWLPLNGNLNQQGIADVTITNYGATVDNAGKIGKCYKLDGTDDRIQITNLPNPKNVTVAFWMKRGATTNTRQFMFTAWGGVTCELSPNNTLHCYVYDGGGACDSSTAITVDTGWVHVVYSFEDCVGGKLYINGSLHKSTASTGSISWTTTTGNIGNYSNLYYNGYINDFRFYDHVLSPREVAEISKGLVLHYPLNDEYSASNLVYNGFGEHGSDGWYGVAASTTDLPNDSNVKASFVSGFSHDFIPVNANNTFTVSCYIKSNGATTGSTYPSIYPYDIDKKFISNYNCLDGFGVAAYTTTLSQPLNKGDTVIHAADLSAWNDATNNYYVLVAIFGYKDSTGYTYPDFTYTQDCPAFGAYGNKNNLDKTNNTITLLSPYTGEPRPVGTTIRQATHGNTYFYPFGGVAYSSIQDWTKKTATFRFYDKSRLRYARYIKWENYPGAKYAGIKITDTTWGSNVVYDTSGFGNNGTTVGEFEIASESPRYSGCTYIKNTSNITHPRCLDNTDQEWTCCAWVKLDASTKSQPMNNFNHNNSIVASTTPLLYLNSGDDDYYMYGSEVVLAGTWTHIAFVFKNSTGLRNIYINGVLKNSSGPNKTSTPLGIPDTVILFNNPFSGYVSDYREYATALTADQVKQLYEAPISLANNGTLFANEFCEM